MRGRTAGGTASGVYVGWESPSPAPPQMDGSVDYQISKSLVLFKPGTTEVLRDFGALTAMAMSAFDAVQADTLGGSGPTDASGSL